VTAPAQAVAEPTFYLNEGNKSVLESLPSDLGHFLDLGCGAGEIGRRVGGRFQTAVGITYSERELQAARPHFTRVIAHDLDTPLPADLGGPFDVVVASHVLEHLRDPERLLRDVRTHMRPGGLLVVALPNLMYYPSRARLLLGRFEYQEQGLMDRTHLRWFSFGTGARLLRGAGCGAGRPSVDGMIPLSRARRELSPTWRAAIGRVAARVSPGLFGWQLLYRARTPHGRDEGVDRG